jgi:hypothetical protein
MPLASRNLSGPSVLDALCIRGPKKILQKAPQFSLAVMICSPCISGKTLIDIHPGARDGRAPGEL